MTTITTIDALTSWLRVGQLTLFISASTEIKKSAKAGILMTRHAAQQPIRRTANGTPKFTSVLLVPIIAPDFEPIRSEQDDDPQGPHRDLPRNSSLTPLVEPDTQHFLVDRSHGLASF